MSSDVKALIVLWSLAFILSALTVALEKYHNRKNK